MPLTKSIQDGAGHDVVQETALFLYTEVGAESVRALEAVAATLVAAARARAAAPDDVRSIRCVAEEHLREAIRAARSKQAAAHPAVPPADEPFFATCLRIARRAVRGALRDETGGAVRFHSSVTSPAWARGLVPCACVGSFLFYQGSPGDLPSADMAA